MRFESTRREISLIMKEKQQVNAINSASFQEASWADERNRSHKLKPTEREETKESGSLLFTFKSRMTIARGREEEKEKKREKKRDGVLDAHLAVREGYQTERVEGTILLRRHIKTNT